MSLTISDFDGEIWPAPEPGEGEQVGQGMDSLDDGLHVCVHYFQS
jgi:hypothetical protein